MDRDGYFVNIVDVEGVPAGTRWVKTTDGFMVTLEYEQAVIMEPDMTQFEEIIITPEEAKKLSGR